MARTRGIIQYYIISCSEDCELPLGQLCIHGGGTGQEERLPMSSKEAAIRLIRCRSRHKCRHCDAKIARQAVERIGMTFLQIRRNEEYHSPRLRHKTACGGAGE